MTSKQNRTVAVAKHMQSTCRVLGLKQEAFDARRIKDARSGNRVRAKRKGQR